MVCAQPKIYPGKWDTNFLGFWDKNGSPNLGQTSRPNHSQQADPRLKLKESKKTKNKT